MTIPDYQTLMLPLLRTLGDGAEHSIVEIKERLADEFKLTEEEKETLLRSGQPIFKNRVGWARTYLVKAGLVESTRRSFFRITPRGQEILRSPPPRIDARFLRQFPEFVEFVSRDVSNAEASAQGASLSSKTVAPTQELTPREMLESGYAKLRAGLADEVLDRVRKISPDAFERLVVDLLLKMGYGGARQDAGRAIGRSGDEGIDGIIDEDKLGLDRIYLQAKRWDRAVPRDEIQKFAGALQGKRARKGVFITTSSFQKSAREFAESIESRIVLIDGAMLAQLMIDHDLGVSVEHQFSVKRLDSDYFEPENL